MRNDKDSILEVTIKEINKNRSKSILKHSELPEGSEEEYNNGWKEFYIRPLKEFIKKQNSEQALRADDRNRGRVQIFLFTRIFQKGQV